MMIVVTSPTANIGHRVVERLLAAGEDVRVVARDPDRLPSSFSGRVEVVRGSHGDPAVVDDAFRQADAVFWLLPPDPKAESVEEAFVGFTRPAAEALARHGVGHVVGITALGRGTPQAAHAGFVTGSLAMDDAIAGSGVSYAAVSNPSFMDNLLRQVVPIRDRGMFFSPIDGERRMPSCAVRDIADTAADLLIDRSWSGGVRAPVLGAEDLSFNDMASIMSDVLGREIRFQRIAYDEYRRQFVDRGMSDAMAQGMTDMAAAKDHGIDNAEPRTPANTTPTSFREWCEDELKPVLAG